MGIIFGKKKIQSRITEQDKAVLQLKLQRDKIQQYQKRINVSLEADRELARKLLKDGKKDQARLLLRKKHYQEQLLLRADGQLENLEKMTHDLEFAQIELQVIAGLKDGNEALKKIHETLDIADLEKIMDETREGIEKQEEINTLLAGELTEEDEDAVEMELNEILQQQLPDVPNEALPTTEEDFAKEKVKTKKKEPEKKSKVILGV